AVLGRLWQLSHPADGGRPGHGFSLCEYAELLGLFSCGDGPGGELLCPWRAHGRRLDPISAPGHPRRNPWPGLGHHSDAGFSDPVHYRLHHGRLELRGDGATGTHTGDDDDAPAPDGMGHFYSHNPRAVGLPRLVRRLRHAAVGQGPRDELLHAGHRPGWGTPEIWWRQSDIVPAPILVLRSSRGLHRRPACLWHR